MRRGAVASLALALLCAACGGDEPTAATTEEPASTTADGGGCSPGRHGFVLDNGQAALLQVGPEAGAEGAVLLVVLHGFGGDTQNVLSHFSAGWDEPGLVLVAPESKGVTWSVLRSPVDEDLESINLALAEAYARCRIDRSRVAVGGFSDGATYALTLAVSNGDLFPAAIAFSPGGIVGGEQRGTPRVFVSHGTVDEVLPIESTGDAVVRRLRAAGYAVRYERFRGGHEVSDALSETAIRWLLDGSAT